MTKTYLITGANRGIGFQFVKDLSVLQDVQIIATARSVSGATELNALAAKTGNIKVLPLTVDDIDSVKAFGAALGKIPNFSIDYFISNAGIAEALYPVAKEPRESYIKLFRINSLGSIDVYQAIYEYLNPEHCTIVFMSSIAGSIGQFHLLPATISAYGASKAYLNFIARSISLELKDRAIVIAMHPGGVTTDMGNRVLKDMADVGLDLSSLSFITPEESVAAQIKVIHNLKQTDTGKFLSYNGTEVPW